MPKSKRKRTKRIVPRHEFPPDNQQICCTECGSFDVEYAVWYAPNTGEVGDEFGSWNAGDNTFCRDCDVEGRDPNPNLVFYGSEPKLWKSARAKWRKDHKTKGVRP